jgi:hypothetical protein
VDVVDPILGLGCRSVATPFCRSCFAAEGVLGCVGVTASGHGDVEVLVRVRAVSTVWLVSMVTP